MNLTRKTFFYFVYSILIVSLALKASLICISYTDSNLSKFVQRALFVHGEDDIDSLYFLSELIIIESTDSNHDQSSTRVLFKDFRNNLKKTFSLKATGLVNQFSPQQGICSHTGIFLCLRL
jgi:hypothetical protein